MTTVASIRNFKYETTCEKCGNPLIAPEWSKYISERLILNLWFCEECDNQFESEAFVPADAESKIDSKVMEEFFPSLLVA